jgi:hypothetical protein
VSAYRRIYLYDDRQTLRSPIDLLRGPQRKRHAKLTLHSSDLSPVASSCSLRCCTGPMEALEKLPVFRIMARSPPAPVNPPPQPPAEPAYQGTPVTSPRSLRQLSVFFLGGACLLASTAITRKAVWRRQLRIKPKFYEANTNPHEYFSPFSDACQAFNLATMNCVSVGIMALGGAMWSFDIANLREAQAVLRSRLNYDSIYRSEDDIPRSFSELIAASGEMRIPEDTLDKSEKTQ